VHRMLRSARAVRRSTPTELHSIANVKARAAGSKQKGMSTAVRTRVLGRPKDHSSLSNFQEIRISHSSYGVVYTHTQLL
jgi:hypothetical protein